MSARQAAAEPRPITYATLADLAEAISAPGAAHLREAADAEREDLTEAMAAAGDELEWMRAQLDEIPEPKSAKHSETCWQRHARCLADRLLDSAP